MNAFRAVEDTARFERAERQIYYRTQCFSSRQNDRIVFIFLVDFILNE